MAKKADLLIVASELKLKVTEANTIAEIEAAIAKAKISTDAPVKEIVEADVKLAKSGKRSEKAIKEVVEKIAKEERKEQGDTAPQSDEVEANIKKGPKPITRSLIERRGKAYRKATELVDKSTVYSLTDALAIALKTNPSKFDASVEIHTRLGVDPKQADQNVRATVSLPNGTGKTIRVAVFAPESAHAAAKKAGADIIGDEDFLKQLDKEDINFDILIATPQYMPKLGKYARLLGPRGLMPNPKSGSVAVDVAKAVLEAKAGKVEYRVDKQAIVHLSVGKVSFDIKKLEENANAFFESLKAQKPSTLKGSYVKSIYISTTQGPSIKVENQIN
ncbi:MAG: large subunit ribosomal protein [Patescibacteria group bacterium]|nr:large subunit ribosomal protein [Patescibacteria group bacterium]